MLKVGDRVIIKRGDIYYGEIIERQQKVNFSFSPFEASYKVKTNNKAVWVWGLFVFKIVTLCA